MKKTLILILLILSIVGCQQVNIDNDNNDNNDNEEIIEYKDITTTFMAVGDNLIHGAIYLDPHSVNSEYRNIYSDISPLAKSIDIAYINQETMLGGTELGLSSYPMFNSPQEVGDAIVDAGFNWVNHATNHTLDRYEAGVIKTLEFWDKYPQIQVSGIARNQEEADSLKIIDKNGLKFGLLSYTYGTNGIPIPDGKDYLVNLIDKEKIEKDVTKLKSVVDVILVSMHWGVEYTHIPNDYQKDLAVFLNELEVDVIIGTHPHVIQPIETLKNENGHETLVIYSLGNFLSAQDQAPRMLGGIVSWDIVYSEENKNITINNVVFRPTITYFNHNIQNFKIYYLKDYTNEIATTHYLSPTSNVSKEYFIQLVDEVIGSNITIDY